MSTNESIKVSAQDIQMVQNLIEQCLLRYMTRKEVMNTLSIQEKIEPAVTELVWQKLEQENPEFFNAYNLRLTLKEQIAEFNKLLDKQVKMMHNSEAQGVPLKPVSGSHVAPMHRNPSSYAPENARHALMTDNIRQPITTNIPNEFTNHGLSAACMQMPFDMSNQSRKIETSPNMLLAHNPNVGVAQGLNGGMTKRETGYSGMPQFMYGVNHNILEACSLSGDAPNLSYNGVMSNSLTVPNETMMGTENTSTFGVLGNYDITPDYSHGPELLDNYRGPFLADTECFVDSRCRGDNQGENRRFQGD